MNLWNRIKLWAWALVDYSGPVLEPEDCLDELRLSAHERQRRSFVYGNTKLANPDVTWELVDRVADEMAERWFKGQVDRWEPDNCDGWCYAPSVACSKCHSQVALDDMDEVHFDVRGNTVFAEFTCANNCNWHPCLQPQMGCSDALTDMLGQTCLVDGGWLEPHEQYLLNRFLKKRLHAGPFPCSEVG